MIKTAFTELKLDVTVAERDSQHIVNTNTSHKNSHKIVLF